MHISSLNENKELSKDIDANHNTKEFGDAMSENVTELSKNDASMKKGIVLRNIPLIIQFILSV